MLGPITLISVLTAAQASSAPAVLPEDDHQASSECLLAKMSWHETLGADELESAYRYCREDLKQFGGKFADSVSHLAAGHSLDAFGAGDRDKAERVLRDCVSWEPRTHCHDELVSILLRVDRQREAQALARASIRRKEQRISILSSALSGAQIADIYEREKAEEEVESLSQSLEYDKLVAAGRIDRSTLEDTDEALREGFPFR